MNDDTGQGEPTHEMSEDELLHFVYQHPTALLADPISVERAYAVDVMRIMGMIVQLKAATLPRTLRHATGLDVFRAFAHALATGGEHPARTAFDALRQGRRGRPDPHLVEVEMRLKLDVIARELASRDKSELRGLGTSTDAGPSSSTPATMTSRGGAKRPAAQIGLGKARKILVAKLRLLPLQHSLTERIIRSYGEDGARYESDLKRNDRAAYRAYADAARKYRAQLKSLSANKLLDEAATVTMATTSPTATLGVASYKGSDG